MKSIYYRQPYHTTLVRRIKKDINDASMVLLDGSASKFRKAGAITKLIRLVPVIINDIPEPTVENVGSTNHDVRILVGIYQKFFRCLKLPSRVDFLKAFVKIFIIFMATDFYRPFIRWWLWEIKKSDLKPLGPLEPDHHFWDETQE